MPPLPPDQGYLSRSEWLALPEVQEWLAFSQHWEVVDSSNLHAILWGPDGLVVQFQRGHLYLYDGVPAYLYKALLEAGSRGPTPETSKGKFLNAFIKPYYRAYQVSSA
jgi:hypothetical protein